MREALIYDLQVERFARGGSTITMQLVKNVFLNRNKNFARKLEEALIVGLLGSKIMKVEKKKIVILLIMIISILICLFNFMSIIMDDFFWKTQYNLFRLNSVKLESKIKVTGKIDLDALNQSTRPKKKTKEEKRKERDEKQKFNNNRPGNNSNGPGAPHKSPNSPTLIKPNAPAKPGEEGDAKKKRKRIKKDRVDVNNTPGTNYPRPNRDDRPNNDRKPRLKKPVKAEVSEEDVQKQIKETLARLTNKNNKNNKGAKYRRDKRDAAVKREHELMEQEELESKVLKLTEFVTANDLANIGDNMRKKYVPGFYLSKRHSFL